MIETITNQIKPVATIRERKDIHFTIPQSPGVTKITIPWEVKDIKKVSVKNLTMVTVGGNHIVFITPLKVSEKEIHIYHYNTVPITINAAIQITEYN